jgi:SAM-dependent methyltransferase
MATVTAPLSVQDDLDAMLPYTFMALVGKRVIHPGGRPATAALYKLSDLQPGMHVLEVGCGVGTTAIEVVRRFDCHVTAVDIDPFMVERAEDNVKAAGLTGRVTVAQGDIQSLNYPDQQFDRVLVEAVLEFVDPMRAVKEVVRVCRSGGRVVDHEFVWRKAPTPEVRMLFEDKVCPPSRLLDWQDLYQSAGLSDVSLVSGIPSIMTPHGFLRDEGPINMVSVLAHVLRHAPYRRKMAHLYSDLRRVFPYLGWVVVGGLTP